MARQIVARVRPVLARCRVPARLLYDIIVQGPDRAMFVSGDSGPPGPAFLADHSCRDTAPLFGEGGSASLPAPFET